MHLKLVRLKILFHMYKGRILIRLILYYLLGADFMKYFILSSRY